MNVPLKLQVANWHLSGEDVYRFDFSALQTPGNYTLMYRDWGVPIPSKLVLMHWTMLPTPLQEGCSTSVAA